MIFAMVSKVKVPEIFMSRRDKRNKFPISIGGSQSSPLMSPSRQHENTIIKLMLIQDIDDENPYWPIDERKSRLSSRKLCLQPVTHQLLARISRLFEKRKKSDPG